MPARSAPATIASACSRVMTLKAPTARWCARRGRPARGWHQRHGDRPPRGLTTSQRNATIHINTQANNPAEIQRRTDAACWSGWTWGRRAARRSSWRRRPGAGCGPGADAVDDRAALGTQTDADALVDAARAALVRRGRRRAGRTDRGRRRHEHGRVRRAAGRPTAARSHPSSPGTTPATRRRPPRCAPSSGREFSVRTGLPLRSPVVADQAPVAARPRPGGGRGVRRLRVAEWIVHALGGDQVSERRWPPAPAGSTWPAATGGTRRWPGAAPGVPCCPSW